MAASVLDPLGDGCTFWPDMTWRYCCDAHDLAYAAQAPKLQADWALFTCVAPHDPIAATLMFLGVTLLGWIWYLRAKRSKD